MRQPGPGRFERCEVQPPDVAGLADGEILLRFLAGGLCGSDTPKFLGAYDPDAPCAGMLGVPLHEVVGRVEASRAEGFRRGDRVVGLVHGYRGLAELIVNSARNMIVIQDGLPDTAAVMIQPVATVLSSLDGVPPLRGSRAVVIGLGPLGLLFTHVLSRRGFHVTGVDRVDRCDVARTFGVDEVVVDDVRHWVRSGSAPCDPAEGAALAVDAVGHQQGVLADAVRLLGSGGHLVAFGLPDEDCVLPLHTFFRRNLSMHAGTTRNWHRFLTEADHYVRAHPELYETGITDLHRPQEAEAAFTLHAVPRSGRLKVVLQAH